MDSLIELVKNCFSFCKYAEHNIAVPIASVSLVLAVLSHLDQDEKQTHSTILSQVLSFANDWVKLHIGDRMFGGRLASYSHDLFQCGHFEIMVCSFF